MATIRAATTQAWTTIDPLYPRHTLMPASHGKARLQNSRNGEGLKDKVYKR